MSTSRKQWTNRDQDRLMSCRDVVLDALRATSKDRTSPTWEEDERFAMASAANMWALAHGCHGINVADIRAMEWRAVGHSDYGPKIALYIAEHVCGVGEVR